MEVFAAGIHLTGLPEGARRLREILLHRSLVAMFLCHTLTQQLADKSRDACISLGGTNPGPPSHFFIEDNRHVSHITSLVLHETRVKHNVEISINHSPLSGRTGEGAVVRPRERI
jgi:hypothetical protein